MTRDMTEDEKRRIREARSLVQDVFDVCAEAQDDAACQAIRAGIDAIDAFLERGEVFEADEVEE